MNSATSLAARRNTIRAFGMGVVVLACVLTPLFGTRVGWAAPSSDHAPQQTATPTPDPNESSCVASFTKVASPKVLLLGETTRVTLRSQIACPELDCRLKIALVLDGSGTMAGEPSREMQAAAIELVQGLDLASNPQIEVGVVEFNDQARTLTYLTNSEGRVLSAIHRVGASGPAAIHEGIREGLKVLVRGRTSHQECSHEAMVVLSNGQSNHGCPPVLQAANQAKSQGVLLITICVTDQCDEQCMRQAASSPRYFYGIDDMDQLLQVFTQIRHQILEASVLRLTVRETLPPNMQLVTDSVSPDPASISPALDIVTWEIVRPPRDGVTLSLEVKPLEAGYLPVSENAEGEFRDLEGKEGSFVFPVPWVSVLASTPEPTSAVTRTPTATATPLPTATATMAPAPNAVYLPICYRSG